MLPDAIKASRVMIATKNAKLQAAAIYSDNEGTRTIIYVGIRPAMQGRGMESALVREIEREAIEMGISTLELDTAVFAANFVALYRKLGFEIVRTGPPIHGLDDCNRVFMKNKIAPQMGNALEVVTGVRTSV